MEEKRETAEIILRSIDSRLSNPWEWDDYFSPKGSDPEFGEIQRQVWEIEDNFPADGNKSYCSEEGTNELRRIAEKLLSSE